jgi:hypothetical protein
VEDLIPRPADQPHRQDAAQGEHRRCGVRTSSASGSRLLAGAAASLVAWAAGALAPPLAHGNGDPASDVLLVRDVYFPYQKPSSSLERALEQSLREASRTAGLRLKVAVIGTRTDLGLEPFYFGRPQPYARFLDSEISFNRPQELLVVMPAGFGVVPATLAGALARTHVAGQQGSDGLVRSAILAVVALARAKGHPIAAPKVAAASSRSSPPALLVYGIPALLLALGGIVATRRFSREREDHGDG